MLKLLSQQSQHRASLLSRPCLSRHVSASAQPNENEKNSLSKDNEGSGKPPPIKVTVTSAAIPPLVRNLMLKGVSVLSKDQYQQSPQENNANHDPVTSLFLRSGGANQTESHGLEFLVEVKKRADEKIDNCPLEDNISVPAGGKLSLSQKLGIYLALGKARLSALVVTTASFGYGIALLGSSGTVATISPLTHCATFAATTVGTAFLAVGANTLNQFFEAPYDSQMPRTRNRPLAIRAISPEHALLVGVSSTVLGTTTLLLATNPLTATLGLANCLLYAAVYTTMKRSSPYNTWIGAIVGALPPLMGWSAYTGGHLDPAAYVLAGILFSWQFPHFMALSWNMKAEYARAGYQVQAVTDPLACRKAALRHSYALMLMCTIAAPAAHLAPWSFAVLSLPVNIYLLRLSYKFKTKPEALTARSLFRFSLVYLPVLLAMLAGTNYFHQ